MGKITIEAIKLQAAEHQWQLLTTEYANLNTEMHFKCAQGHDVFASWQKVRGKFGCPICKQTRKEYSVPVMVKQSGITRILALDQASHTTGYALFDDTKLIKVGTFVVDSEDEIARDNQIKSWLISMINNLKIDYIGLEGIQFQDAEGGRAMGVTVFQTLARLQGVLMETCYELKIPYMVCPTNTWRHHCGVKGRSRADRKRSMQLLTQQWYGILASDDESDAIGIGKYVSETVHVKNSVENWET